MYEILVPVADDVDLGLTQAGFVKRLPHASEAVTATLTHALHDEELDAPDAMQTPERVGAVRDVRDRLESAGIEVTVDEIAPSPAEGILDLADDIDADLIVLGARKMSPAGKAIFGSVTQSVLLNTDRPVTVTGQPSG